MLVKASPPYLIRIISAIPRNTSPHQWEICVKNLLTMVDL